MLKILVAIGEASYAEEFMTALLPKGFEVYIVEKQAALLEIARQRRPDIIVFDTDVAEYHGLEGIGELRQDPTLRASRIIVFSKISGLDFVKAAMRQGVVGYLYKPIAAREIEQQIERILEGVTGGDQRREFVRVKPAPFEESHVEILAAGGEGISGSVLDISLGGVALRLSNSQRASELVAGRVYPLVRLALAGEPTAEFAAEVVLARGDMVAIKFRGLPDEALRILCRYIHNRLLAVEGTDAAAGERLLKMV